MCRGLIVEKAGKALLRNLCGPSQVLTTKNNVTGSCLLIWENHTKNFESRKQPHQYSIAAAMKAITKPADAARP